MQCHYQYTDIYFQTYTFTRTQRGIRLPEGGGQRRVARGGGQLQGTHADQEGQHYDRVRESI